MKTAYTLVTGANGFIGQSLSLELILQGHLVRATLRNVISQPNDFSQVVVGSIDGETDWSIALRDVVQLFILLPVYM